MRTLLWRFCASFGLLVLLVTVTPFTTWWARAMAGPVYTTRGDVLIVLAGSTVDGQFLGESSYWRSVYAVMAWRTGGFHTVILSGRAGGGTPAAELMRGYLVAHGVPDKALVVETESESTYENARRLASIVSGRPGRHVLLTSDYHMPRAMAVFRKQGLRVDAMPAPDAGKRSSRWRGRWPAFLDLCTESAAWVWYWVQGWV